MVDSGDDSDHLPICVELMRNPQKPASPFKFCAAWIKHEEVLRLIHSSWIPYGVEVGSHAATHFVQNLASHQEASERLGKKQKTPG